MIFIVSLSAREVVFSNKQTDKKVRHLLTLKYKGNDTCYERNHSRPIWENGQCSSCEYVHSSTPYYDTTTKKCISCYKHDEQTPVWSKSDKSCKSCTEMYTDKIFQRGDDCVTCFELNPGYPILNGTTCLSCSQANPMKPYWDGYNCVEERPHMLFYGIGLIMIAVSFVLSSVVKLIVFHTQAKSSIQSQKQQVIIMSVMFFLIVTIAVLVCAIGLMKYSTNAFLGILSAIIVCFIAATCITGIFTGLEKSDEDQPKNIKDIMSKDKYFLEFVIETFVIKTIGMVIALIFAAADIVQLLSWTPLKFPESGLNTFLMGLGTDIGYYKLIPIILSIMCNMVLHDTLIKKYFDSATSRWTTVQLELLYLGVELIDNYAALCLGNLSQQLWSANPVFAFILGLMMGQLYASDLWAVCGEIATLIFMAIKMVLKAQVQNLRKSADEDGCVGCFITGGITFGVLVIAQIYVMPIIGVTIFLLCGQIIPPIIDMFALPFSFFFTMLGFNVDVGKYEFSKEYDQGKMSGEDQEEYDDIDNCSFFKEFFQPEKFWSWDNLLKIVHRAVQFFFSAGLFLLLCNSQQAHGKGGNIFAVLEVVMIIMSVASLIDVILELIGAQKLGVRMRSKIPEMRRKVNTNYLENRADNRYGLIPFAGPVMSGLCAFLNQPPLVRNGKLLNWDSYVANIVTYLTFFGAMLCYEFGQNALAIILLIVVLVLSTYDVIQDVREVLGFSFGVFFLDNFKHTEKPQEQSEPLLQVETSQNYGLSQEMKPLPKLKSYVQPEEEQQLEQKSKVDTELEWNPAMNADDSAKPGDFWYEL